MKCRSLVAFLASAVASLAFTGPAAAAPGSGAQVINTDECYVYDDFTACESQHAVYNPTETGSGSYSGSINTRFDNSFTGSGPLEGCSDRTTGHSQQHYLFKPDAIGPHQQHYALTYQYSVDCPGIAYICTVDQNYTYANGEVRHERSHIGCAPRV